MHLILSHDDTANRIKKHQRNELILLNRYSRYIDLIHKYHII